MSENLTASHEDPEIDLDAWISNQLPIKDAKSFYAEVLEIDPNHCKKPKEVWFMFGLHEAAYGSTERLSLFLLQDEYHVTLTKPKRKLMAWILKNSQSKRMKMLPVRHRMRNLISTVVDLMVWCDYGKTAAIETTVEDYLNLIYINKDLVSADEIESRRDSLNKQIFKAIRKGGDYQKYFAEKNIEANQSLNFLNNISEQK